MMKKILMAAIGLAALSTTSAYAADLPARVYTKAPAVVAPEYYNWTGFYIGAHVGGAWAHSTVTDRDDFAACAPTCGTVTDTDQSGIFGGGQIGYNWQIGTFVLGIEGDGGFMDLGGDTLLTGTNSGTRVGLEGTAYADITGRLGLTFGRSLIYVKGGWAFLDDPTHFSTNSTAFISRTKPDSVNGAVIGGGIEYKFTPNWSAKIEYLHFDFGDSLDYTVLATGGTFRFHQDLDIDTVKVGLNYAFGWDH